MKAIRRRLPAGLRWQLTIWVAGVLLVAAVVVFAVVYETTGTQLRHQTERDIAGDTTQLSQFLAPLRGQSAQRVATAAERYVRAQPYRSTSTLLFVLVPSAATISNHPEVFDSGLPDTGSRTVSSRRRPPPSTASARLSSDTRPGRSPTWERYASSSALSHSGR